MPRHARGCDGDHEPLKRAQEPHRAAWAALLVDGELTQRSLVSALQNNRLNLLV
jgi:hypothetical protein